MSNVTSAVANHAARRLRVIRLLPGAVLASVLAAVLTLALAGPAAASAQATGEIRGRIVDGEGEPLPEVTVTIEGTSLGDVTGDAGRFAIARVPVGIRTLRAERLGYGAATRRVDVTGDAPVEVRVVLTTEPLELAGVTAIGTREELAEVEARIEEIPGAVTLIRPAELRRTRQANFKDVMRFTPGVWVQPRFGAADESQFSIRGSGLRNNFHLRGVNVLINGMPYRNADGFTDFESLELLTTENIQIYKAANALRFGGSTLGGAVNLETKTGHTAEPLSVFLEGGAFGFLKGQVSSGMVFDDTNYYLSYAPTRLDGFRTYSDQRRDRVNVHVGHRLGANTDFRAFYLFAYVEENLPGALTREQLETRPERAHPDNVAQRFGRDYSLHHAGAQLRTQLTPDQRIEVAPYFQYRDIVHPIFRVLNQDSRDWGAEARYENSSDLGGHGNRFLVGVWGALGEIDNRHFENVGGESGALAKNQEDRAGSVAVYAEDVFDVSERLSLVAGVRFDRQRREVEDFFLEDGDQTDTRYFDAVSPRLGALVHLPGVDGQVFANASRFFEPPLLLELNSFTRPGFIDLGAQKGWQYEVGTRGRAGAFTWDVSLYDIEIEDEIININVQPFPDAPFTVPTYRNVPETRHYGAEVGLSYELPLAILTRRDGGDRLGGRLSYTLGRFRYEEDPEFGENELPGVPEHAVQAELVYRHPAGWTVRPNVEWIPDDYFVDSDNTVRNEGWTSLGFRAEVLLEEWGTLIFVEGKNMTDERYSPAVVVDDASDRFFLPADGRSLYVGARWHP